MKCLNCGAANPDSQRFCGDCGTRLSVEGREQARGEQRNYTPTHLADRILKSRGALEGERKQVTVLFCDIANSTPLAARIGADRMHKVLNAFFEAALAEVHRYEGTVNQFLGDGFMALFGAPLTHEDHARRAALAALAIRKAVATDKSLQAPGIELKTRIGLNSGAVVVGRIGDNLRMDYTAIGDTTNVAARIQAFASEGMILASENVARIVQGHVECNSIGSHTLKGKDEPVALFEIVGEKTHRAKTRLGGTEALVGRRSELATMSRSLDELSAGRGGVLAVFGQAGLGKSRLLHEVSRLAADGGLRIIEGSCLSFGRTLSYWVFREALLAAFDILETDSEATSWSKFEQGMTRLFAEEAGDLLPYAGSLLALQLPEVLATRVRALDTLSMGHQIFRSTFMLLERLGSERPTLLVLEDWHWADASSAELLNHLLPLADRVPLLFLIASRPEAEGAAGSLKAMLDADDRKVQRATALDLAPLGESHAAQLAQQLLGGALPHQVTDLLLKRSGGNPFYLGELVRVLAATNALDRDPTTGEWRATEHFGSVPLPETIEGVILARIDRLDDEVKQVLKTAAVVGRSFFYRVLRAIADTDAALDEDLSKLRKAELIDEKQMAPELEYIFKHPLIQQATYDSLLEDRRRELHRKVGECIESLFADRLEPFYSMLAYHYVKAEDETKGREYLLKAAEHADRLAADEEALELYGAVIEALERQTIGGLDGFRRAELESKLGEAHFRAGRHEQALLNYTRALRRIDKAPPRKRWITGLSVAVSLLHWAIRPWIPEALRPKYRPLSPREALACQIWETMMWINFFLDMLVGVYGVARIGKLSARDPRSRAHITSLSAIGMMCTTLGLYKASGWSHTRARALASQFGDEMTQANADHFYAWHLHEVGRWSEALQFDIGAAERGWKSGNLRFWCATQIDQVLFLNSMGRPYREVVERMRRVVEQTPDQHALAWMLSGDSMELQRQGRHAEAIATVDRAIEIYVKIPDVRTLALSLGIRCRSLHHEGRESEAEVSCSEAESLIRGNRLTGTVTTLPLLAAADFRLAQFELAPADRSRERAAKRAVKAMWRQGKNVQDDGAVERYRVAGTLDWLFGQRERAMRLWATGLERSAALDARYARARILLERGRRTNASDDLQQAAQLFSACEALREREQAERLLASGGSHAGRAAMDPVAAT